MGISRDPVIVLSDAHEEGRFQVDCAPMGGRLHTAQDFPTVEFVCALRIWSLMMIAPELLRIMCFKLNSILKNQEKINMKK